MTQAVVYNNCEYQIERASRETVRARFGHGGARWFLHSARQMGFGEVDGNWEWGYPLAGTVRESKMLAELKLVCPWVIPTCTADAPSITQILRGLGAVGDVPDGPVRCELVTPTEIQIRSGGGGVATVRICLNAPPDPAVAPIRCVWRVECQGVVDCWSWPDAFEVAIFGRSDR